MEKPKESRSQHLESARVLKFLIPTLQQLKMVFGKIVPTQNSSIMVQGRERPPIVSGNM